MSKDDDEVDKNKLFKLWKLHLANNSKLPYEKQIKRAKEFTRKGMVPNE